MNSTKELKDYCSYLIDTYKKLNPQYEDSHIYWMLKEYNDTGLMKDMICEDDSNDTVSSVLSYLAVKINNFYTHHYYLTYTNKQDKNEYS